MEFRGIEDQTEHDTVVMALADIYHRNKFNVWTNPGQERNKEFKGVYPDVIVKLKNEYKYYLFEVETESSVSNTEAIQQWKPYSNLFNFILVVPKELEQETTDIIDNIKIKKSIFIVTYIYSGGERVYFYGLPGLS